MPQRRSESPAVVPAARERATRSTGDGSEQTPDLREQPSSSRSPLRSTRRIVRRIHVRIRELWRTGIVRRATRARRAINRRNARRAIATLVLAGLAVAVVLELEPADELAGYGFAFLSGFLGLAVLADMRNGEIDLDVIAATSTFGALALFQLL